jgi:hypothetical protein
MSKNQIQPASAGTPEDTRRAAPHQPAAPRSDPQQLSRGMQLLPPQHGAIQVFGLTPEARARCRHRADIAATGPKPCKVPLRRLRKRADCSQIMDDIEHAHPDISDEGISFFAIVDPSKRLPLLR